MMIGATTLWICLYCHVKNYVNCECQFLISVTLPPMKTFAMNLLGMCKACPSDPNECYQDGFVISLEGKQNCAACMLICWEVRITHLTVNGEEIFSNPITNAINSCTKMQPVL